MHVPSWRSLAVAATCLALTACTGGGPASGGGDSDTLKYLVEEPEDAAKGKGDAKDDKKKDDKAPAPAPVPDAPKQ